MVDQFLQEELEALLEKDLSFPIAGKNYYLYGESKKFLIAALYDYSSFLVSSTIQLPEEFKRALELNKNKIKISYLINNKLNDNLQMIKFSEEDLRNPFVFFLQYDQKKKFTVLHNCNLFLENLHSDSLPTLESLSIKRYESLENQIVKRLFEAIIKSKLKFQNNRSILIGFNVYKILLKKIKYDKFIYEAFISSIFSRLKELLLNYANKKEIVNKDMKIDMINSLSEEAYMFDRFVI